MSSLACASYVVLQPAPDFVYFRLESLERALLLDLCHGKRIQNQFYDNRKQG